MVMLLRRSQEQVEAANQRIEQTYLENKRRFREKEELWENEMKTVKAALQGM